MCSGHRPNIERRLELPFIKHAPSPLNTQGMNYLAGFLLITLADCILSEREDLSARSSRISSSRGGGSSTTPVVSATASATTSEVTLPPDLQLGPSAEVDVVAASKEAGVMATSEKAAVAATRRVEVEREGKGEDEDVTRRVLTDAEVRLIENESVQVMHGVIALQGGVLSRDLWGLHAVSGGKGGGCIGIDSGPAQLGTVP